jgi:hypothetical protein
MQEGLEVAAILVDVPYFQAKLREERPGTNKSLRYLPEGYSIQQ